MTDPGELAEYFGFTESEVTTLCEKYQMNFEEAKAWYDGYDLIAHRQSGDEHYSMWWRQCCGTNSGLIGTKLKPTKP